MNKENDRESASEAGFRRLEKLVGAFTERDGSPLVVYLTAEWLTQVDALVLPYIEQKLESTHRLVVLERGEYAMTERSVGCDEAEFRQLGRELNITHLPACVILHKSSPSNTSTIIDKLMLSVRNSSTISDWLPLPAEYAPLDEQAPSLINFREEAKNLFEEGDFIAAAKGFTRVLMQCSTCPKSNFNMSVILQMLEETYFAVDHMLRVVEVNDHDAVAHTVLRTVLHPLQPDLVIRGYESIVARHATHVRAAHSLATLRGDATSASPEYVQQVFDHLAETFEDKLVNHLEYRVPWQLVDALQRSNALQVVPGDVANVDSVPYTVVDLGCGTGLCGRLLRPFASYIAGMDLSPRMIEKTQETGFYDELETADIIPFLTAKTDASLDLVVSADVWIYVGELDEIFALVAQKLRRSGWFAFSTELLASGDGFQLAPSGRFKHSEAYVSTLASRYGFAIHTQDAITVRKESGEPIPGRVFVFQLA